MNMKYIVCVVLVLLFVFYVLNKDRLDSYISGASAQH